MSAELHTVTLTFDGYGPSEAFACHAPADALCHAVWTCDCPGWEEAGVEDGVPWHNDSDATNQHLGTLDPDRCNLREWFENSNEPLHGQVTFPVCAEWEGDYYTFHPVTTKETIPDA